ncbi:CocE/NonD family hydrolase [Thermotalea metallivorans]|nr:CocE/NonD family hydrolase [Thermotalea metallivorans]
MSKMLKLPPAETYDIAVERDLKIPMSDGVILLADHYYPRTLGQRPTILIRSMYPDRTKGGYMGEIIAERGFQVVIVSGRGVCGSGGEMTPFMTEHEDGVAVLSWLKEQTWFDGCLGTLGQSYLGFTQWAIAYEGGSMLKAMSTQMTSSDLRSIVYPGNAFSLEVLLGWLSMIDSQEASMFRNLGNIILGGKRRKKIAWHLPLIDLDKVMTGKEYEFWRSWLIHDDPKDDWWAPGDHSHMISKVTAPNHMISGWHDFMLPSTIRDYNLLRKSGQEPYLTIGPWTHFDTEAFSMGINEALIWLRAHLLNDRKNLRDSPVRIFVMGSQEWREYPYWPPANIKYQHLYFQPSGGLSAKFPPVSEPDHYCYDPVNPTPSVGGFRSFGQGRPVLDNRFLEERTDVLTYTSDVLDYDMEIIGPVSSELFIRSTLENTDFFVRVCDVDPSGKSLNVCDGLLRLAPGRPNPAPDGIKKIKIELWPTAYCFQKGHRIRIQVSSGSFPRWNRNLGTYESLGTGMKMAIAEQLVYHDPHHPSAIILPTSEL